MSQQTISPVGQAPVLTAPQARLVAQQLFGGSKVSCHTIRPGAYLSSRVGFWETLIVDMGTLTADAAKVLRKWGAPDSATVIVDAESGKTISFHSPFSHRKLSAAYPSWMKTRSWQITLLTFKDEAWCCAAIHAGILPKGRTLEQAFEIYDARFAKSRHESLALRARLLPAPSR